MRKLLVLCFLFSMPVQVMAKCDSGYVIKPIGTAQTATGVISASAGDIHGLYVACSATACAGGIYDSTTVGGAATSNMVAEPGAVAGGKAFFDYTDSPLYASNGISFISDGNVDALIAYRCQDR